MSDEAPKMIRVYITKYALSSGVYVSDNALIDREWPRRILIFSRGRVSQTHVKPHWHETEDEARDRVRTMVLAKIRSLDKSRVRLSLILDTIDGGCFGELVKGG